MELDRYQDEDFIDQQHIEGSPEIDMLSVLNPPFDRLVRISIRFSKGVEVLGTGCLIRERIVLTCLHVLTLKTDLKIEIANRSAIKAYVGQNGPKSQQMEYDVADFKYDSQYFNQGKRSNQNRNNKIFDYALLLLQPKPGKVQAPLKDILLLSQPEVKNPSKYIIELYGYDSKNNAIFNKIQKGGQPQYKLWGCQSDVQHIDENFIDYKVDTEPGKSGAPLITYCRQGIFKIIGIHLGYSKSDNVNFALRISDSILSNIACWLTEWKSKPLELLRSQIYNHNHNHDYSPQPQRKSQRASIESEAQRREDNFWNSIGAFLDFLNGLISKKSSKASINQQGHKAIIEEHEDQAFYQLPKIVDKKNQHPQNKSLVQSSNSQILADLSELTKNKSDMISYKQDQSITKLDQLQAYTDQKADQIQKLTFKIKAYFEFKLIPKLNNLTELKLNNCSLHEVPVLTNLHLLHTIDVADNLITKTGNLFIPSLLTLILDFNRIQEIPEQIIKSQKLVTLSLNHNTKLSTIHDNIFKIHLRTIEIAGNDRLFEEVDLMNKLGDSFELIQ